MEISMFNSDFWYVLDSSLCPFCSPAFVNKLHAEYEDISVSCHVFPKVVALSYN